MLARAIVELATIASASAGIRTSATVLEGTPVATLRELAGERGAGMLATGTAAREGLEHVLQGSLAGELTDASCPVMIVAPDAAASSA